MPRSASFGCSLLSAVRSMVLMLMITSPGWAVSMKPPGPTITSSACAVVSTMEMSVLARRAVSAGLEAACAPRLTARSTFGFSMS
jgi:hypothetical protein